MTSRDSSSWSAAGPVRASPLLPPRLLPSFVFQLAKDAIKEILADRLGLPATVEESQRLGRTAVSVMLEIAGSCPVAVLDSTWFEYTEPLLAALPGVLVEVHCDIPVEVAQARYYARAGLRHAGHLDRLRSDTELWVGGSRSGSRHLAAPCEAGSRSQRP